MYNTEESSEAVGAPDKVDRDNSLLGQLIARPTEIDKKSVAGRSRSAQQYRSSSQCGSRRSFATSVAGYSSWRHRSCQRRRSEPQEPQKTVAEQGWKGEVVEAGLAPIATAADSVWGPLELRVAVLDQLEHLDS